MKSLKNNLAIFDCLFGLYVFSHQSCATGTLLLPKDIYPRKYRQIFTNLFFSDVEKTSCINPEVTALNINSLHL